MVAWWVTFPVCPFSILDFCFPQAVAMSFCQEQKKSKNFIDVPSMFKTFHLYPSSPHERRPGSFLWLPRSAVIWRELPSRTRYLVLTGACGFLQLFYLLVSMHTVCLMARHTSCLSCLLSFQGSVPALAPLSSFVGNNVLTLLCVTATVCM